MKEVTDAWTAIEGKVAEEKDRHITTYAYSDNDACGADGSLCKDGDKVHADRGTSKAKHSALDGLYTTYDGKVTPYITEFEK